MSDDRPPLTGKYRLTQGPLVARLRRQMGLSQAELGRRVGRTESWMGQVERGAHEVDRLSVLRDLADALGVSVFDLVPDLAENRHDRAGARHGHDDRTDNGHDDGTDNGHGQDDGPGDGGATAGRRVPRYRQIADDLRSAIESGDYGSGDRLPGERALMDRYGVARMTARQALSVLAAGGLTTRRGGAVLVTGPPPPGPPPSGPRDDEDALRAMAAELREIRAILVEFGDRLRHLEDALLPRDDGRDSDIATS